MSDRTPKQDSRIPLTDGQSTDEDRTTASTSSRLCDECGGDIVDNGNAGEKVCTECGLVISDNEIDRSIDYSRDPADGMTTSGRTGPAQGPLIVGGLQTKIDPSEAHSGEGGEAGPARPRWARWQQVARDHQSDTVAIGIDEIRRIRTALALPEQVAQTAAQLFRRVRSTEQFYGRTIEAVATAALYTAAKLTGAPRGISDVEHVARVGEQAILQEARRLSREYDLPVEPVSPAEFVPQLARELPVDQATEAQVERVLDHAHQFGITAGRKPVGQAAAAVYAVTVASDRVARLRQKAVAEAAGVTVATVSRYYPEYVNCYTGDCDHSPK